MLLSAAIICSCSTINEDRTKCPCWYTIDFTEVDRRVSNLHLWIFDENGVEICRDSLHGGDYGEYNVELGRGKAYCYVWGNILNSTSLHEKVSLDSYFVKADNCSSDPLYFYAAVMETAREQGYDRVELHKEYARVDFTVKGNIGYKWPLQMEILLQENGRYVNGGFVKEPGSVYANSQILETNNHIFTFIIMRQSSLGGIVARITAVDDGKEAVVKELPFGQWLISAGYDMNARDLEDIKIELDIAMGILSIKCAGWQRVQPVKIEI